MRAPSASQDFSPPVALDAAEAEAELAAKAGEPIIWVGQTVAVHNFPLAKRAKFTELLAKCDKVELRWNSFVKDAWWSTEDFASIASGAWKGYDEKRLKHMGDR